VVCHIFQSTCRSLRMRRENPSLGFREPRVQRALYPIRKGALHSAPRWESALQRERAPRKQKMETHQRNGACALWSPTGVIRRSTKRQASALSSSQPISGFESRSVRGRSLNAPTRKMETHQRNGACALWSPTGVIRRSTKRQASALSIVSADLRDIIPERTRRVR
jgi:hypothetical protein